MGGAVGDTAQFMEAAPQITIGSDHVWFLSREDMPGAGRTLTVNTLSQGVFDVVTIGGLGRAVSQASGESMVPDPDGLVEAPGGKAGLELNELFRKIRDFARVR